MTRKKILLLSLIILLGLLILLFMANILKKKTIVPATIPTPTSLPTYIKQPTSFPIASPILPSGEKVKISEVEMNNFFKSGRKINNNGDVLVVDNERFQILYLAPFQQFLISILASPFDNIKKEAETDFLHSLAINEDQACKLEVWVNTTQFTNPDYAGRDYPLSFCEKKQF